jgi:hypothetical protein
MERKASKRARPVIPVQRNELPFWDDDGGVFTQETPRISAGLKKSSQVEGNFNIERCRVRNVFVD